MNLNPPTNIDMPLENLDVKLRPMENNPEDTQIVNSNQQVVEEMENNPEDTQIVNSNQLEIFQPLDSESQEGLERGSEFCPEGSPEGGPEGGTEGGPEVVRELPLPHEVILFGLVVLGLYYVWKWFNRPKAD